MFYSVLIITAIASALYVSKRWRSLPAEQRKDFVLKAVLWGVVGLTALLVLSGRTHWLMGVLAALIALAGRAVQLAQYFPIFKKLAGEFKQDEQPGQQAPVVNDMSRQQAADILGVDATATPEEVRVAHKRLMQKIHPDRGGTDALAIQINQAKDILLA